MKPRCYVLSLVLLVPALLAQEPVQEAPAQEMPNPKTKEHDAFAGLVGTWSTHTKTVGMPGVPGMEEATEGKGFETAELVCNGLWLKVTGDSTCNGQVSNGIWLLGYDPFAQRYKCLFAADAMEEPGLLDAVYDSKTKTFTFTGKSPMGEFRSVFVLKDKDTTIETVSMIGEHGTEKEMMRIERKRHVGAVPKTAPAAKNAAASEAPAGLAALLSECGTWDAEMKMEIPGAPAMESKCQEVVKAICGGKWTWSNYTGTVMGAPFEGHALTGWDATKQRVVSYWIDTMSAPLMQTEGVYDASKKQFALRGTSYDEGGASVPVTQVSTRTSETARELRMTFGEGEGKHVMTILYTRTGG